MDLALWVLQVLLALAFLGAGFTHAFRFDTAARDRMTWMLAVGKDNMRIIGWLEILGAIGLLLPAFTGILPSLTPLAAALFALLMVVAIIFHARRAGEVPNIVFNVILGVLALAVAYGRLVLEPF
jgi:uncharacterized membrane protein YphA (DoxX/SURF4 family)